VAITGLKDYVEGLDSYVTSASLKDNKLTITQNNGKGNYEVDLSGFADQFSGTDYRVVANPAEGSKGIYKPDASGKIELTVQDAKTGATSKVQLSDVASATTVNNNYTTLDTKIDKTKTDITNAYTTTINETKNTITNEYKKYVSDTEDYVTSGSISGDTITLKRALGGEVAITGLKDYVEGLDSYVTSASLKDNKLTITQNNGKGNYEIDLSGFADQFSGTDYRVVANPAEGSKGIYKPDASGKIELTVQDAKTGATSKVQLSDIASATTVTNNYNTLNTKVDAAKTTLADGKNTTVEASTAEDGHTEYKVNLNENVKLGDTIQLNGSDGSISATSGTSSLNFNNKGLSLSNGKNSTVINGGTITVNGGESVISGTQATFGKIKLNAESGSTITGLSNTTTKYDGFATAGRAATEEQLKEVAGKAGEAVETAGKGWNLTTNGKEASKTNIAPDGMVDFSSSNDNLLISNAGANLSFSLSDNLDLTNNKAKKGSVKVGENTALSNELLQVGKDVSLTASALNVGNSSLTTSALMVGGLTYINSSGLNANSRVISNVAAGTLDTDAVNVGQLKSAISGSQVSIKAGDGISVAKTGNQYTINVNIEGLSNEHGTVHVSTDSDPSVVTNSDSTESGTITPKRARSFKTMLLAKTADVTEAAEATTTTEKGKPIYIKYSAETSTINANDGTITLNDGEAINIHGDDKNITTTVGKKTGDNNKEYDTISVKLNDDIKVQSVISNKVTINNGPTIDSSGINMNKQKITNLKDGEIAEGSTDAVNGGQLYNTNQAVIANAENINSLSHSLNKLDSRINRVGAGAAALAALHPLDFDPDNKWDFAAGYGNYAGANAVAIGTYYRPNENTMFSIGGSFGGGENMINAGVSFKLGSGGSGITTSKTVMAKKIKEQDELLKAQDAKMKEQDEKIAKLEALVAQQGEMIQQALGKK
ncbi:YadA-like family protein, partial [Megasphaera elsdenii]|uniref:YadA-like family protein n=1 Tax=Megasphaera elsdenii TaxID=907 RepID=UPI00068A2454